MILRRFIIVGITNTFLKIALYPSFLLEGIATDIPAGLCQNCCAFNRSRRSQREYYIYYPHDEYDLVTRLTLILSSSARPVVAVFVSTYLD